MIRSMLSAAAVVVVLTLLPARSQAGEWYGTSTPSCTKNADGSGYCWTSVLAIRSNADPHAWVNMQGYVFAGFAPNALFSLYLNGSYYSCFTSDPVLAERLNALTSHNNLFYISWSASGTCLSTESSFLSYSQ